MGGCKMRRILASAAVAGLALVAVPTTASAAEPDCWGQLSAAFAQTGAMGEHSSQQPNPRLGLPNLARALYENGVIGAPTLTALGAYLNSEVPELNVDACT
jgi:hypothetical protein